MKVKFGLAELSTAWSILHAAVPVRSPRPVLSNIKICCSDKVTLSATDLEIGIRYLPQEVEATEPGECLLNAERVGRVLRENPSESVEIESTGGIVKITCKNDEFEIPSEDPEHFPQISAFPDTSVHNMEKSVCQTLIRQTAFSAAHEETRYALNGVLFDIKDGDFTAVATDGKRLSRVTGKCKGPRRGSLSALVPLKGVLTLEKILPHGGEEIQLSRDEGNLYARANRIEMICRLLEGNFPEYEDVIPGECPIHVRLNRQDFASKLRMADAFTTDDSRAVRLSFSRDSLTITANVPDSGKARVVVAAAFDGEDMDIAFNPQYFLDAMKVISDETVMLGFRDSHSSAKMTAGDNFTYVVMPLSLD